MNKNSALSPTDLKIKQGASRQMSVCLLKFWKLKKTDIQIFSLKIFKVPLLGSRLLKAAQYSLQISEENI